MKALLTVTAAAVQHTFQQGSRAWQEHRYECNNASDAAAMMGCDDLRSRTDLLDALYLGFQEDVSDFKQGIYDRGHRFEGLARPLAEQIMGEDLYPLVLSRDWSEHGIRRPLGASLDGATITRRRNWEHKQLNTTLAEALPYSGAQGAFLNVADMLPKKYRVQMEQQCMVDDAEECLFTASDWNDDDTLKDVRHCWYRTDPELRAEIVATWVQGEADLAAHQPRAAVEKVVAEPVAALPALVVRVEGRVVESNLAPWRDAMITRIKGINRELTSDQHFADAKAMVTLLEDGGKKLVLLKEQVLAGAGDILTVMQSIDTVKKTMDETRLELDRLVTAREKAVRKEIADEGRDKLTKHLIALDVRLSSWFGDTDVMPRADHPKIAADFDKAIKNKRTIKSLRDSVDAELARAKIAASALADLLEKNGKLLHENREHRTLFADWRTLIFKEPDDCALAVRTRIADHLAEVERKRQEAEERQRREQEEAQRRAEEQARQQAEAANQQQAAARNPEPITDVEPRYVMPTRTVSGAEAQEMFPARSAPTLKLGEIQARLSPLNVTAEGLVQLGFPVVATDKGAKLYREEDFLPMLDAMQRHLGKVGAKHREKVAA